ELIVEKDEQPKKEILGNDKNKQKSENIVKAETRLKEIIQLLRSGNLSSFQRDLLMAEGSLLSKEFPSLGMTAEFYAVVNTSLVAVNSIPNSWDEMQSNMDHESIKKIVSFDYEINKYETKHYQLFHNADLLKKIKNNPNTLEAKKATEELQEDYKEEEIFKKRFLEAHTNLQTLKIEKEELVTRHDKLEKIEREDPNYKKSLLAKFRQTIKHAEEKIIKFEHCLEADLKGFLIHKEVIKEHGKDILKEKLAEAFIEKVNNTTEMHKSNEREFIEELNKSAEGNEKEIKFDNFLNRLASKNQENINSKKENISKVADKQGSFVEMLKSGKQAGIARNVSPGR
ncbi:hypothetical protein H1Q59_05640, partial [Holosporaceae bacterium 'Namur']|nr:hypothetical protein [Holosporaceae bacterium 'Namur']